ncbi:MAG: FAD-dependent oxidoreductase [Akkermansiaceae bacterium]|nr:FAD-dependent oxidoreductase [Akkermansiaceae bacterium]MCP5542769.1 FAD-dependent oxidoreductase [Akkermansiaceae bacterium]MCP5548813.1 FAD-dependent oxidoreductase [Akkermansiaceae bacterium]
MPTRRKFIASSGAAALSLLASGRIQGAPRKDAGFLFIEAEGFDDLGGWELDQQSMDQMGSPYLLAHGLGIPVMDAVAKVSFPAAGRYRLWVRTRDWVAPWKAPGAPGRFQVLIDGRAVEETFGTKEADWHWHDGGMVDVPAEATIALHDLTGFEGRCEALLFCADPGFQPSNDVAALETFRRKLLGLPEDAEDGGSYDLVVVGGGLAGTCAAVSAARNGLKVALVQDRPVLGGNASSEVRVWPEGHIRQQPFPHIGEIVEELLPDVKKKGTMNGTAAGNFDDARKLAVAKAEPNLTLFTNHRTIRTEMNGGSIAAVIAQSTVTARRKRIRGRLFADCTGDAIVGHQAGADSEFSVGNNMGSSNLWRPLDAADKEAVLKCECKDKDALTAACEIGETEQPFPRCPWAIDLTDKPFPGRKSKSGQWGGADPLANLGGWFWESGFDKDPIADIERIRDLNLRAMYGAWDALKNVDKLYSNHRLGWAAFIAGKRESRRLLGDVVLSADDFRNGKQFEDSAFPCSWHIDLHTPDARFDKGHEGDEFISRASSGEGYTYQGPYWAPYRTLYSRNVPNLFMAGRNISVSKDGLGPVRVMRTCGMMGEIVGKAAAICIQKDTTPRGVYPDHLATLHEMMLRPGAWRAV